MLLIQVMITAIKGDVFMDKKLDDFLIGPQADEMNPKRSPEMSDEMLREIYDKRIREKYDRVLQEKYNSRRVPDISEMLDNNQDDFDYGE